MTDGAFTVLPDTNVWRYWVDAGAVEVLRKAARATNVRIVACPAVVNECLRTPDRELRNALAKAITRDVWLKPMPEAFVECEDLRREMQRLRPHWLLHDPDLRHCWANRADWQGGFWRRVRRETDLMAHLIGEDKGLLSEARTQAREDRVHTREATLSSAPLFH